jgi:hypothetical protein
VKVLYKYFIGQIKGMNTNEDAPRRKNEIYYNEVIATKNKAKRKPPFWTINNINQEYKHLTRKEVCLYR